MSLTKPFDLVIFDCDGVLIDSEKLATQIDADELARNGFPTTFEDVVRRYTGLSAATMRRMVEGEWGRPLPSDFEEVVAARIKEKYLTELEAIDGIAELLGQIAVPRCVASSSAPEKLRLGLERTGLWPLLEPHVFSTVMVSKGKPAPDLFLFAADRMGADPARTVVVEDSIAGVQAGVAAGMTVIGFTAGGHCLDDHDERLLSVGASVITRSAAQLKALLCTDQVRLRGAS
ncbi:HAD family hydrolase [Rhizobium grahamii]|uniref:HAD family hydrolase n=1 Tax=Rhizobium grahamii CCGE 502 TaxID=990285 RepID=S3I291_9HYPH|nr:HAD family hydrolase [Rhizobium grahamii]EPE93903.1 hypothetical protein RGCCGE502_33986 [Rhizobium grahamii CCGE 502]